MFKSKTINVYKVAKKAKDFDDLQKKAGKNRFF